MRITVRETPKGYEVAISGNSVSLEYGDTVLRTSADSISAVDADPASAFARAWTIWQAAMIGPLTSGLRPRSKPELIC